MTIALQMYARQTTAHRFSNACTSMDKDQLVIMHVVPKNKLLALCVYITENEYNASSQLYTLTCS